MCFVDYAIRLQSRPGDSSKVGRVEIFNNGRWGLICANGWDSADAIVVCQETELGVNGTAIEYNYDHMDTVWLSGVTCVGNESHLFLCPHNGIGVVNDCAFIAGVECFGKICTNIKFSFHICDRICENLPSTHISHLK